jgi:hypothetical protein
MIIWLISFYLMQADGSDNSRNDSLKDFFRSVRLGKVNDVK